MKEWIGVDLDGTLAKFDGWKGMYHIGEPVPIMLDRVKEWIRDGEDIRIFSVRATMGETAIKIVEDWCQKHIGCVLPITDKKDIYTKEIWDDIAVRVKRNLGIILGYIER